MVWRNVRGLKVTLLLCVTVALTVPGVVWGADPLGRFSLSARFGVSGYNMSAVNDAIGDGNFNIENNPESADWKVPDKVHYGFDFLGDAAFDISHSWRAGITFSNTSGTSKVDFLQAISVEPHANLITPRVFYRLPFRPMIDMSLRVYGGMVFMTGAEVVIEHENTSEANERLETLKVEASGTGVVAGLFSEYTLADRFSLTLETGYRAAKATFDTGSWQIANIDDPRSDADEDERLNYQDPENTSFLWGFFNEDWRTIPNRDLPTVREDLDIDFSGAFIQIGLRVYIF